MKKLNNILIGLAFVVGASIAVPLYMYISNSLFHKGNDAKAVIPIYMQNSEELTIKVPDSDPFNPNYTLFTYKSTTFKSTLKNNGNGYLFKATFYSANYKKYFIIRLFDYSGTMFLPRSIKNKEVIVTVNKDDFNNPYYGSLANPVPVFKFRGVTPLKFGDQVYDISEEEYKYNVTQYLQYLMTKEEFKKRFKQ
ncbi:hypothetical protein ABIB40_004033 [Pedobacter sp. UYP30]|uniref:hypothetical protein n=1 Tax=Pedobacter sp. UYP30 TaxID=1756400 RepID=UPI0033929400